MPVVERAVVIGLVLGSLWCVLALARARRGRLDVAVAVLLAAGSLLWLFGSRAYEGPTVVALSADRGLTIADLGVPTWLALSAAVVVRSWRVDG